MTTIGVLTLLALAAPTFGVYASVVAQLAAEVIALGQISVDVGVTPPEIGVALAALVALALQLDIAIDVGVPSLNASFSASAAVELALLLGIDATLAAAIAVGGAGIEVVTYGGAGASMGAAVGAKIASGWSDGTPANDNVMAVVLGATSSAAFAAMSGFFPGATFATGATVCGSLGLAALCSADFELLTDLLSEFKGRANAAAKAVAGVSFLPPSCAASAQVVATATAKIQAALAIGMPAIKANLLAFISSRIAIISALSAQISAQLALATDGFDVFTYSGPGSGLGPALTSTLAGGWPDGAGPTTPSQALVLAATTPAATVALSTFFPPVAA
jgi:hypothetical protein